MKLNPKCKCGWSWQEHYINENTLRQVCEYSECKGFEEVEE